MRCFIDFFRRHGEGLFLLLLTLLHGCVVGVFQMTLWFNDKGINYLDGLDPKSGSWLDRVLWLCAEGDYVQTISEERMRECVLLNLFNQLRSALKSTDSYRTSSQQCATERRAFAGCIANKGGSGESVTNGEAATRIIVALRDAQQKLRLPAY